MLYVIWKENFYHKKLPKNINLKVFHPFDKTIANVRIKPHVLCDLSQFLSCITHTRIQTKQNLTCKTEECLFIQISNQNLCFYIFSVFSMISVFFSVFSIFSLLPHMWTELFVKVHAHFLGFLHVHFVS